MGGIEPETERQKSKKTYLFSEKAFEFENEWIAIVRNTH
jgi:hypothetical protein